MVCVFGRFAGVVVVGGLYRACFGSCFVIVVAVAGVLARVSHVVSLCVISVVSYLCAVILDVGFVLLSYS